jgi:hypothetical protein
VDIQYVEYLGFITDDIIKPCIAMFEEIKGPVGLDKVLTIKQLCRAAMHLHMDLGQYYTSEILPFLQSANLASIGLTDPYHQAITGHDLANALRFVQMLSKIGLTVEQ